MQHGKLEFELDRVATSIDEDSNCSQERVGRSVRVAHENTVQEIACRDLLFSKKIDQTKSKFVETSACAILAGM